MALELADRLAWGFARVESLVDLNRSWGHVPRLEFLEAAGDLTRTLREAGVLGRTDAGWLLGDLNRRAKTGGLFTTDAEVLVNELRRRDLFPSEKELVRAAAERILTLSQVRGMTPLGRLQTLFTGAAIGAETLALRWRRRAEAARLVRVVQGRGYADTIPAYRRSLETTARLGEPEPIVLIHGTGIQNATGIAMSGFVGGANLLFAVDANEGWLRNYVLKHEMWGVAGWLEFTIPFFPFLRYLAGSDPKRAIVAGHIAIDGGRAVEGFNRLILGGDVERRWVTFRRGKDYWRDRREREAWVERGREVGAFRLDDSIGVVPYPARFGELLVPRLPVNWTKIRPGQKGPAHWIGILLEPLPEGVDLEALPKGEGVDSIKVGQERDAAFFKLVEMDPPPIDEVLLALRRDTVGHLPEVVERLAPRVPERLDEIRAALREAAGNLVKEVADEARTALSELDQIFGGEVPGGKDPRRVDLN